MLTFPLLISFESVIKRVQRGIACMPGFWITTTTWSIIARWNAAMVWWAWTTCKISQAKEWVTRDPLLGEVSLIVPWLLSVGAVVRGSHFRTLRYSLRLSDHEATTSSRNLTQVRFRCQNFSGSGDGTLTPSRRVDLYGGVVEMMK